MRLKNRSAVITGAGRGIGRAIAEKFLIEGAHVILTDVVEDRLTETTKQLQRIGRAQGYVADVSRKADCEHIVNKCIEHFNSIDIVVNNAGIAHFSPFINISEDDWDRVINVNLKGVFLMSQIAAKEMIAHGQGGSIVNMASTNAHMGERDLASYNASKAGVNLLTKTMAIELAQYSIRVNSVSPGQIRTELAEESGADEGFIANYLKKIPLGRYGRPEEVADLFAYLASDEASFITGESIVIDGGQISEQ